VLPVNLDQDDTKVLVRTATSPRLLEDPSVLDALMKTDGWQTLLTFARESAREFFLYNMILFSWLQRYAHQLLLRHRQLQQTWDITMTRFLKISSIRLLQKRLLRVEEVAILESGSVPIAPLKMTTEDMTVKFAVYP
jgi:hypothetical protein